MHVTNFDLPIIDVILVKKMFKRHMDSVEQFITPYNLR